MKNIELWIQISQQLKNIKKQEGELRRTICTSIFKGAIKAGTYKESDEHFEAKAVYKINTKFDKEALTSIYDDLSEEAQACFKFDPELIMGKLNKLDENDPLWDIITTEPAMPGLEAKAIVED